MDLSVLVLFSLLLVVSRRLKPRSWLPSPRRGWRNFRRRLVERRLIWFLMVAIKVPKVLMAVSFTKINLDSVLTPRHLEMSHVVRANCSHMWKSSLTLMMALFAYFQRADPNLDGLLSTTVPVSTIRATNKVVEPVLDLFSMPEGKNPSLTSKWGHTTSL